MKNNLIIPLVILGVLLIIVGVVFVVKANDDVKSGNFTYNTTSSANNTTNNVKNETKTNETNNEGVSGMYSSGLHHATIEIKDYGTIKLELNADVAPITVTNFAKLVNEGFYDGLTFHRIMDGFMMQGGDPLGNGNGGSDEKIKGEFAANSIENNISHVRGTISMARATPYNSASSQFFIVHKDSKFLDGQYAGFGHVTEGIEVVDQICSTVPVVDNNGTVLKENQPIIEKITMED